MRSLIRVSVAVMLVLIYIGISPSIVGAEPKFEEDGFCEDQPAKIINATIEVLKSPVSPSTVALPGEPYLMRELAREVSKIIGTTVSGHDVYNSFNNKGWSNGENTDLDGNRIWTRDDFWPCGQPPFGGHITSSTPTFDPGAAGIIALLVMLGAGTVALGRRKRRLGVILAVVLGLLVLAGVALADEELPCDDTADLARSIHEGVIWASVEAFGAGEEIYVTYSLLEHFGLTLKGVKSALTSQGYTIGREDEWTVRFDRTKPWIDPCPPGTPAGGSQGAPDLSGLGNLVLLVALLTTIYYGGRRLGLVSA